jgi:hypothetical protein
VDADIAGFFDAVSHEWLIRFVEHRVGSAVSFPYRVCNYSGGILEEFSEFYLLPGLL